MNCIEDALSRDPNEDAPSHDVLSTESAPSANNPTQENPADLMAAVEPHPSRVCCAFD